MHSCSKNSAFFARPSTVPNYHFYRVPSGRSPDQYKLLVFKSNVSNLVLESGTDLMNRFLQFCLYNTNLGINYIQMYITCSSCQQIHELPWADDSSTQSFFQCRIFSKTETYSHNSNYLIQGVASLLWLANATALLNCLCLQFKFLFCHNLEPFTTNCLGQLSRNLTMATCFKISADPPPQLHP